MDFSSAIPGIFRVHCGSHYLVPFTYTPECWSSDDFTFPHVYMASSYGGSITESWFNTPGTPGFQWLTTLDGYPLTRQGKPGART